MLILRVHIWKKLFKLFSKANHVILSHESLECQSWTTIVLARVCGRDLQKTITVTVVHGQIGLPFEKPPLHQDSLRHNFLVLLRPPQASKVKPNYLFVVIFKMATIEICKVTYRAITSRTARVNLWYHFFVSTIFLGRGVSLFPSK